MRGSTMVEQESDKKKEDCYVVALNNTLGWKEKNENGIGCCEQLRNTSDPMSAVAFEQEFYVGLDHVRLNLRFVQSFLSGY